MFETTNQSWIFIEIDGTSTEQNNWAGLASRPSSSFSLRRPEWTLTPSCANLGAENQPLSPWSSDSGFFWVRRVSVPVFFNILWLGNVGNWRFNLFGLRRTGEAWPRSTEGGGVWKIKSLTFQSKNQKKKNVKILGFNGTIIHWNQIIREKSSTGKLSTKPVIVPISPGLRCWPGPSGNLLQPQNGRGACKRSMGKCTPWSTLSIQHSFPLFSPKAFKNFKTAYGFRRILIFDITVCVF